MTSYSSIYNVGHQIVIDLLKVPVLVEEKIDGSQFSFGVFGGELKLRSKGKELYLDAPEKMFNLAVKAATELKPFLMEGWTYRAEYLSKPKHNTLAYSRIPAKHLIIFDINPGEEQYLSWDEKKAEASRLGLECVPRLFEGMVQTLDQLKELLATDSILGGTKVEGIVLKPLGYNQFGPDKKCLMAKFVSEAFKEKHSKEWKNSNPSGKDFIGDLGDAYKTEARWQKAVQHLCEAGELEGSPRDIGKLLKEATADVFKEEAEEIKERLFKFAWPHIARRVVAGLPEWYKNELAKRQFEEKE